MRNLPTAECLIWWKEHGPHDWAYTSTGGGHIVDIGSYDEKGYKEWHCPGIEYAPKHRSHGSPWIAQGQTYIPKHRSQYESQP